MRSGRLSILTSWKVQMKRGCQRVHVTRSQQARTRGLLTSAGWRAASAAASTAAQIGAQMRACSASAGSRAYSAADSASP
jgi:hypothetical protein